MPPVHLSQNTYKNLDTRRQSLEYKLLHPVANELLKYRMMELPGVSGLGTSSVLGGVLLDIWSKHVGDNSFLLKSD